MERKYKKTYELKQVIKAYAEWASTYKFTRKLECEDKWHKLQDEAYVKYIELLKKHKLTYYSSYSETHSPAYNIRLLYVAYGLLRKMPYPKIERPREENELSKGEWEIIQEIKDKFKEVEVEVENV